MFGRHNRHGHRHRPRFFRTIMAYPVSSNDTMDCSSPRITHFSNPDENHEYDDLNENMVSSFREAFLFHRRLMRAGALVAQQRTGHAGGVRLGNNATAVLWVLSYSPGRRLHEKVEIVYTRFR